MQANKILSWVWWPLLFGGAMCIAWYGFHVGKPLTYFNITYFSLIYIILVLEHFFPYERQWVKKDGQTWVDIAHTVLNKGTVQGIVIFGGIIGLTSLVKPVEADASGLWPTHWPMVAQVVLAVLIAEFMLYWTHRLSHEHDILWRLHAVHHSVRKLWVVNTGRFHVLDSIMKIASAFLVLIALDAPMEVIQWLSVITAFIGVLTHCNVEMRCGWLSYIFNTPELHRWHHSKDKIEGNSNYGENVVIWDLLFGTYYSSEGRLPPVDIGINDEMPARFGHQLLYPFRRAYFRKRAAYQHLRICP